MNENIFRCYENRYNMGINERVNLIDEISHLRENLKLLKETYYKKG